MSVTGWVRRSASPAGVTVGWRGLGQLEDVEGALCRRGALGAGVELGADVAQRQVGLRGEQQDEQRGLVPDVPGQQPQPHLHGHQRGRQRGGQLQHERRQERDPQGGHGSGPVLAGHVLDDLGLGPGAAERLERGQALDHVEEMAAEPGKQQPLAPGARGAVAADEDGEERDERQCHGYDQPGQPVRGGHPGQYRQRHQAGEHERRQVPGEVGVEGVEPRDGQRGDLARPLAGQPGRAEPQRPGDEAAAQLRLDPGGGAQRRYLAPVGDRRAAPRGRAGAPGSSRAARSARCRAPRRPGHARAGRPGRAPGRW